MSTKNDKNKNSNLPISDVIKSLDELIKKEEHIVTDLAFNKMLNPKHDYDDEQKLLKYKYRVSSLKDFKNSL